MNIALNPTIITDSSFTVRDRIRSRNVKRWHTCDTVKEQTVADHSHGVGIIAEELLERLFINHENEPTVEDRYYVLKYAQVHDLPEVLCGDLSSVFKSWLCKTSVDFADILHMVEIKLVPELSPIYNYFKTKPHLTTVCKVADILESYNFITLSMGLDKQHNDHIIEKHKTALAMLEETNAKAYPELNWKAISELTHEILHGRSVLIDFEKHLTL